MRNKFMSFATSTVLIAGVSACGSSTSNVNYATLDQANNQVLVGSDAGDVIVFDASTRRITINGVTGQVSRNGRRAVMSDGTTLTLTRAGASYAVAYVESGSSSGFGAYGVQTEASDLPVSGSASYSGITTAVVTDASGLYDLRGDATMSVDFSDETADLTFQNLEGVQATGISDPSDVDDFGVISISDIELDGTSMSGRNASISSSYVADLSSDSEADVSGSFYGPGGDEVAGQFSIDDSSAGTTNVVGNFILD